MEKKLTISFLVGLGVISLLLSFPLDSVFLVFIGLGLIIWGTSFIFISSTKLVKANLVIPQLSNSMLTLDNFLKKLNLQSKSYFLPPTLPGENPIQKIVGDEPDPFDLSLIPSGLNLEWSFEKKSKVDFMNADLDYLKEYLPIVFTDELGLANDLEISIDHDPQAHDLEHLPHIFTEQQSYAKDLERSIGYKFVSVKLTNFILQELCENVHKINDQICKRAPCPICSAIACAITKVTHKAVSIEKTILSGNIVEIWFRIFEPT